MTVIYDNKVNNIAECNLLHDIINSPTLTKHLNIQHSPILYVSMITE